MGIWRIPRQIIPAPTYPILSSARMFYDQAQKVRVDQLPHNLLSSCPDDCERGSRTLIGSDEYNHVESNLPVRVNEERMGQPVTCSQFILPPASNGSGPHDNWTINFPTVQLQSTCRSSHSGDGS